MRAEGDGDPPAFDLLIGAFEVHQAKKYDIPHLLVVPALVLTFLLGPVGLVLFYALRLWKQRRLVELPE